MEFLTLWKIPGRKIRSAMERRCQTCRTSFGRSFRFSNFAFFLCFLRKKDISYVTILCDSECSLHPKHFFEDYCSVCETSRGNVSQMLEKCRKCPLSKNEDTNVVRHFEENNYQGDDLHANSNKID